MTPHEQTLILKVADEVRTADRTTVDREAERLIRAEVAAQPNAAYILTQRVIVQDLALQQARTRIDELEARLRSTGATVGGPVGSPGAAAPPESAAPTGGGRSGVGDFLKTAAAAAAGTIGAELIYDGLRHWAAGHGGGGSGLIGGLSDGGFLPASSGRRDFEADTSDQGGGDFGTQPDEDEQAEGADDNSNEDVSGGDWGGDDTGGDDSAGAGGDW